MVLVFFCHVLFLYSKVVALYSKQWLDRFHITSSRWLFPLLKATWRSFHLVPANSFWNGPICPAGRWSWKSKSAEECVTTHLPNEASSPSWTAMTKLVAPLLRSHNSFAGAGPTRMLVAECFVSPLFRSSLLGFAERSPRFQYTSFAPTCLASLKHLVPCGMNVSQQFAIQRTSRALVSLWIVLHFWLISLWNPRCWAELRASSQWAANVQVHLGSATLGEKWGVSIGQ